MRWVGVHFIGIRSIIPIISQSFFRTKNSRTRLFGASQKLDKKTFYTIENSTPWKPAATTQNISSWDRKKCNWEERRFGGGLRKEREKRTKANTQQSMNENKDTKEKLSNKLSPLKYVSINTIYPTTTTSLSSLTFFFIDVFWRITSLTYVFQVKGTWESFCLVRIDESEHNSCMALHIWMKNYLQILNMTINKTKSNPPEQWQLQFLERRKWIWENEIRMLRQVSSIDNVFRLART